MATANLPPVLVYKFTDANGDPLAGGKVYFYQAGTTTPQAAYSDSTGTTPLANPLTLDANGAASFWLKAGLVYKINVTSATGVHQANWPIDNVLADPGADSFNAAMAALGFINLTGADGTGATDSTAAFTAAINALPAFGGTIYVPAPSVCYKMNLVITKSGVNLIFGGTSSSSTAPTGNYIAPYDVTKPVIQIANGARTSGVSISNACIFGNNTGYYGIAFAPGAFRCFMNNVQILNFTKRCLQFYCSATQPCTYNKINGLTIATSVLGADGVYFEDQGTDDNGYTTANDITNFDITADGGYQVRANSANGNFLCNGYIQQSYSGLGVLFEKGYTRTPQLYSTNVVMDNASGSSAVNLVLDMGQDWQTATAFTVSPWLGHIVNTGYVFNASAKPTGTINASSTSLTVSSASGVSAGRYVVVSGAGVAGRPLVAKVLSISGTTATLDTAATTSVSGSPMYVGDAFAEMPFAQGRVNWFAGSGVSLAASHLTDLLPIGAKGSLYKGSGLRAFEPLSGTSPIWDLGGLNHYYLQDDGGSYTVSSITQGGAVQAYGQASFATNVMTVTSVGSGSGSFAVGQVIEAAGVAAGTTISSLGTGTGGMGTYNLSTSPGTIAATSVVSRTAGAGTAVVVTTSGNHNGAVGDLVQITGSNENGINGTSIITTSPNSNQLVFSSAVSQSVTSATGSLVLKINKVSQWRYGNLELGRSLKMRTATGTWGDVLFTSTGSAQMNLQTPDTSTGSLVMSMGSAATTSARFVLLTSVGSLYANGYGAVGVGANNGDTSLSLSLAKRAAGTPATNSAYGTIYVDSTGALKYISPGGTATNLANA